MISLDGIKLSPAKSTHLSMLPTLLSLATCPAFFRSFRLVSSLSSAHRLPLILARPRRPLVALREPTVASHTPPTSVHPTESKFPFRPGGHDTSQGADLFNMSGRKVMVQVSRLASLPRLRCDCALMRFQPINILFSLLQKVRLPSRQAAGRRPLARRDIRRSGDRPVLIACSTPAS
jgi:hypothetical protein